MDMAQSNQFMIAQATAWTYRSRVKVSYFYKEKICLLHGTAINSGKLQLKDNEKFQKTTKAFYAWISCGEAEKIGSCEVTKYEATKYNKDIIQQEKTGKVPSALECIDKCLVGVSSCKSVTYEKPNEICNFHSSAIAQFHEDGLEYDENSVYVAIHCAIPVVSTKPVITEIGPTFLNIQWDSATDVYNMVNGYRLKYKVTGDKDFQSFVTDLPHDGINKIYSQRITDLTPDTSYVVQIVTIGRGNNAGHPSPEVEGHTNCQAPTAPPDKIRVSSNVQNKIDVSWVAPPPDTWQCSKISYEIQFKEGNAPDWSHKDTSSRNVDFQTKPHTTWTFQLRTKNRVGNSKWSDEIRCTTAESAPGQVHNVQGQATGHDNIRVIWEPPLDQNGIIRHYTVSWILKPPASCPIANVQANANDVTDAIILIQGLRPAFEYEIKIRAKTVVDGPDSASISVTTLESAPTKPPAMLSVTQVSKDDATISWGPPPCENCNGQLTQYDYELEGQDAAVADRRKHLVNASADTKVDFKTLIPNSKYKFRVCALTAIGPGPYSEYLEFTTRPGVPSPPRDVKIDATGSGSIAISFLPPSDAQGTIDNYRIQYKIRDEDDWRKEVTKTADELPYAHAAPDNERLCLEIIDLTPNTEYVIQAAAHTQNGEWGNPSIIDQSTADAPIPQPDKAPVVSNRKKNVISLSWQPLDGQVMKYANGYMIEYKTTWESKWKQSDVISKSDQPDQPDGSISGTVQNLEADTQYAFRFCVVANVKRGDPSPEIKAHTACGTPTEEPEFEAIAIRYYAVQVKFKEPEANTWQCSKVALTIKYTSSMEAGEITVNQKFDKYGVIYAQVGGEHDFSTEPNVEWKFQMRTEAMQNDVVTGETSNWSPKVVVKSAPAPRVNKKKFHNCDVVIYEKMRSKQKELIYKGVNIHTANLKQCIGKCLKHHRPCRAVNRHRCEMFGEGISDLKADNRHELDEEDSYVVITKCDEIKPSSTPVKCSIQDLHFIPNIKTRVMGGTEAKAYSWPWQIRLAITDINDDVATCGGSLIRIKDDVEESDVVVTAGHCVTDMVYDDGLKKMVLQRIDPSKLFFIAGDHSKKLYDVREQHRVAIDSVVYSEYKKTGDNIRKHDIALVLLESSFKFSDVVRPICLPTQGEEIPEGRVCVSTGWGVMSLSPDVSPISLRQVAVDIHSATSCSSFYSISYSEKEMLCAGTGTKGSSQGDSGGPLQCKSDSGEWFLYGVVSYGFPGFSNPPVYARVTNYVDWIKTEAAKLTKLA